MSTNSIESVSLIYIYCLCLLAFNILWNLQYFKVVYSVRVIRKYNLKEYPISQPSSALLPENTDETK